MAASTTGSKTITVADLMGLGSNVWAEVVHGELIIKDGTTSMGAAGFLHVTVIDNIYDLLKPFVKAKQLGYVLTDGLTYILSMKGEGIELARLPDLSFIRKARIPKDFDARLPFPGARSDRSPVRVGAGRSRVILAPARAPARRIAEGRP